MAQIGWLNKKSRNCGIFIILGRMTGLLRHLVKLCYAQTAYFRLPFYYGSNGLFAGSHPILSQNKKIAYGDFLYSGADDRDTCARQFYCLASYCSLIAPDGAAHHSFTFDFPSVVLLTRMRTSVRTRPVQSYKKYWHNASIFYNWGG